MDTHISKVDEWKRTDKNYIDRITQSVELFSYEELTVVGLTLVYRSCDSREVLFFHRGCLEVEIYDLVICIVFVYVPGNV